MWSFALYGVLPGRQQTSSPFLQDFQEDYSYASSIAQDYVPVYSCLALGYNSYFYKNSEVEEVIKNLVELPADLEDIYNKLRGRNCPILDYRGTLYVPPAELERCKNWASVERKPLVFPDTEGVWFFKLGDTYFKSTTPSYWLFLYNQFGYLNQEKLTEENRK